MPGQRLFNLYLLLGLLLPSAMVLALIAASAWFVNPDKAVGAIATPGLQSAITLSLLTATIASLLGMLAAIPASYLLARRQFVFKPLLDVLLDLPMVLSPVAIGIMLLVLFRSPPGNWLQEQILRFVFEVPGIILAQFVIVVALQVRVLKAVFEGIPERMEVVARLLGCSAWQAFLRVTLPVAKPGLLSALILGWARALGEYGATVTVAGAVRNKTETIPVAIVMHWNALRVDAAIGLVLLSLGIAALVLLAIRRLGGEWR